MRNVAIALLALALAAACAATDIEADDEVSEKSDPACTQPCWDTYTKSVDACDTAKDICEWWHSDNWEVCIPPFFKCVDKASSRKDGCLAGCGQTWPAVDGLEGVESYGGEVDTNKTVIKKWIDCMGSCQFQFDQAMDACSSPTPCNIGPQGPIIIAPTGPNKNWICEGWEECASEAQEESDECEDFCNVYFPH